MRRSNPTTKPTTKRSNYQDHYDQPEKPRTSGSTDPDGTQAENGSAIARVKLFLENVFSYHGVFWMACGLAVLAFMGNVWFYFGLATGVIGLGFFLGILGALLISFGTTLFQLMPKLQTATARMALRQIFVAASKPTLVPMLDPKVVSDSKDLIADYRDAEVKRRDFFKGARKISFMIEAFIGVLFIGNIGAGGGALFALLGFALSVWGVEAGVTLALKAGEDELPPQIKAQLQGLLDNDGKALRLSGL